jgi:hypothetical protein
VSPFGVFNPSPADPPSVYPYAGGAAAAAAVGDSGNNGFKSDSYGNNGYNNGYSNGFGAPGRPPLRSAYETPAAAVRGGSARSTAVTTTAVPVSASGSSSAPTPAAATATGSATTYLTAGIKKDVAGGKGGKPWFEGSTPAGKAHPSSAAAAGYTTGAGSSANVVTPDENMKGGGSGSNANGARGSLVTAF